MVQAHRKPLVAGSIFAAIAGSAALGLQHRALWVHIPPGASAGPIQTPPGWELSPGAAA